MSTILRQSLKYETRPGPLGGVLLKHSLYPLEYLANLLPAHGAVLDLGCGEGMLTNLLAERRKSVTFRAVDLDGEKIEKAKRASSPNAHFERKDILHCTFKDAAAAVFNDVLHHHSPDKQVRLLKAASGFLDENGLLILKEVDVHDKADVAWTSFWDRRLYPQDALYFHGIKEWQSILSALNFRLIGVHKVSHPWPSSRTILVFTKRSKLEPIEVTKMKSLTNANARKVLVTGATGFIGEHLVRELLSKGVGGGRANVAILTRDRSSVPGYLTAAKGVTVIVKDLSSEDFNSTGLEKYEYVFHLASRVDFFAGGEIYDQNVRMMKNLLKFLPRKNLKRFIYTSSMGAVDRTKQDDCRQPIDESSIAAPVSFYGRSKLDCEKLLRESSLPYSIVRIPWCYGPGMAKSHHMRSLFEELAAGGPVFRFDWPGKVSIIEVGELVAALRALCSNRKAENETLFISDGEPISFGALFRRMGEILGQKRATIRIPAVIVGAAFLLRRWIPFRIKCLFLDVLSVSDRKQLAVGQGVGRRDPHYLLPLARYIALLNHPSRQRSRVMVTGAASGIGMALSRKFYSMGYSLLLVDKDRRNLAPLASALQADYRIVDLSELGEVDTLLRDLSRHVGEFEIVVNNAGLGARGNFEAMTRRQVVEMVNVNCLVPAEICRMFLSAFLQSKRGTLINIASSAAYQPLPYMAVYAASKSFMLSFSEAITGELSRRGEDSLEIITVSPSGTATSFQKSANVKVSKPQALLSPDDVADRILSALGKGSTTIDIGMSGRLMSLSARLLPRKTQLKLWENLMKELR